jgi:hypothetical protein
LFDSGAGSLEVLVEAAGFFGQALDFKWVVGVGRVIPVHAVFGVELRILADVLDVGGRPWSGRWTESVAAVGGRGESAPHQWPCQPATEADVGCPCGRHGGKGGGKMCVERRASEMKWTDTRTKKTFKLRALFLFGISNLDLFYTYNCYYYYRVPIINVFIYS